MKIFDKYINTQKLNVSKNTLVLITHIFLSYIFIIAFPYQNSYYVPLLQKRKKLNKKNNGVFIVFLGGRGNERKYFS
jgi:uncharacterized membrane protein YvbJ